ncbi:MAG: UDP-N-acetylmuramate--L-alanine ligase [Myxococcota bacterium]|nr:UDP-N-acetylmuramate--L-alanine ligase [Myxococcota bacterium]
MNRKIKRIHFVGIGGIGMCGLAELLHNQGYTISGSDLRAGESFNRLTQLGLETCLGHDRRNLGQAQVVVVSSAVAEDNPELLEARERKIPVIRRAEMLAEIMRRGDGIAVAGSHGKTTTTSLIAHVLHAAGLDPTAIIGGRVLSAGQDSTGARLGRGDLLVAEADESDGSFLSLAPVITVITNIDHEHMDHYGDFETLQESFIEFANRIPFWGAAVVCAEHPGVQSILPRLRRRVTRYGFSPQAEWVASDLRADAHGTHFRVQHGGRTLGEVVMPLPGEHNVLNALACLAVADEVEVDFATAARALESFGGVQRRFQRLGRAREIEVVDDYAHHPTEIRATLSAARSIHPGRTVAVFQPHRYTRTRDCMNDFATAFNDCDLLVISEIYAAGEDAIPEISGQTLRDAIAAHGHRDVRFVASMDEIVGMLVKELEPEDWVLTLGAGDITQLGPRLLRTLEAEGSGGTG